MYSIYHFFAHLLRNKAEFVRVEKLEDFPFDVELLSFRSKGKFPDMAIRINSGDAIFTGGELIELKDSETYSIASFNSTIPTGNKDIASLITSENSSLFRQMKAAGDDVFSLPTRDVFYLVRGREEQRQAMKVCLVHGSFFETVKAEELIQQAFSQVLDERLSETNRQISEEIKSLLVAIFSKRESFSKVRDVERASVKLRFRIMTEAKAEGNILKADHYPEIGDNTLNLVLPCQMDADEQLARERVRFAASQSEYDQLRVFRIKHPFNGEFLVCQTTL